MDIKLFLPQKQTTFENVLIGNCFYAKGEYYMKIVCGNQTPCAVNLKTGFVETDMPGQTKVNKLSSSQFVVNLDGE
jgi:hypothetical protein